MGDTEAEQRRDDTLEQLRAQLREVDARVQTYSTELGRLDNEMRTVGQNLSSALHKSDEAERRLNSAQCQTQELTSQRGDLRKRVEEIRKSKKSLDDEAKQLRLQFDRRRYRYNKLEAVFEYHHWKRLFLWDELVKFDDATFEALLDALDRSAHFVAEYRTARVAFEQAVESTRKKPATLGGAAKQGHIVVEPESRIRASLDDVVSAQLRLLESGLDGLPKLPPAANPDAHDLSLSRKLQLKNAIEKRRSMLREAWNLSPDTLLTGFADQARS